MGTTNSQQIKTYRRYIAKQGNIGGRKNSIILIRTVKSGSYQTKSQLGICTIMRSTDDTEVKLLVLLILVRIIKVVKKLIEKASFPYSAVFVLYRICWKLKQLTVSGSCKRYARHTYEYPC